MGFDQPAAARANALGGIRADEHEALIEDVEEAIRQLSSSSRVQGQKASTKPQLRVQLHSGELVRTKLKRSPTTSR
jgi:hypothetical protein